MSAIRPVPTADGLLAATAKVHAMTFVTRDTGDVSGLDVALLNPFVAVGS
jgi:toxin FitB